MGKILTIRVMAQTYDEDDVAGAWPRLCLLAWPEWSARLGLDSLKTGLAGGPPGGSVVEKALGARRHGVMELASALPDVVKFCALPGVVARALEEPAAQVEKIRRELEAALGDWDVKKASDLTFALEDAIGRAEAGLGNVKA